MAATWETTITVINCAQKRMSATAVRTDGVDIRTVGPVRAKFNPGNENFIEFKARIAAQLNRKYLDVVAGEAADVTLVGDAETAINTLLNGMEV